MKNSVKNALNKIQAIQEDLATIGVSAKKEVVEINPLKTVVTDEDLYKTVHKLFDNGHHAQAVIQGCIFLDKLVSTKSGIKASGEGLMRTVFSPKNPILQVNDLTNSSEEDEQRGHMDLYAGRMTAVRNPRAHEHDWEDTELRAIQFLSFINYLVERARTAKKNP